MVIYFGMELKSVEGFINDLKGMVGALFGKRQQNGGGGRKRARSLWPETTKNGLGISPKSRS